MIEITCPAIDIEYLYSYGPNHHTILVDMRYFVYSCTFFAMDYSLWTPWQPCSVILEGIHSCISVPTLCLHHEAICISLCGLNIVDTIKVLCVWKSWSGQG